MRPDTFTITTFWLDWLLMPLLLAGAWLTLRWAIVDLKQAAITKIESNSTLPSWLFSTPLFVATFAWLFAGFGTLIKEDYWEMRVILIAFILWTLCCVLGVIVLFFDHLQKGRASDKVEIINLIGLAVISISLIVPAIVNYSSPACVNFIGHIWFVLLAISVGLLLAGITFGFPYKFPRFPLGLGILFLVGWGLSEIAFRQASFPWLVRIWRPNLGLDYLDAFPISAAWVILGSIKVLLGIATVVILIITNRRQNTMENREDQIHSKA